MALERRLRVNSDPEGANFIDLGLRALVVNSLRCEMTPPQAALVRLGETALEIVLDPGSICRTPPEPFTSDPDDRSWFLSRRHSTVHALQEDSEVVQMDAPFPALVSIGRDERGLVFVDLEQAASVDVTGANSGSILGTIAIELATAKWADQVELILVGFDETLDALERVNHVPVVGDVVPKVLRRVRERTALLASVGRHANWEIRWAEGGDSWDLCVVICARSAVEADPDGAASLARIAGNGGFGLAVVLGAGTGTARWHIDADEGRVALKNKDVATSFSSQPVDLQFSAGVASLVEVASQLEGVLPTDPPYDRLFAGPADPEESRAIDLDGADSSETPPQSRDCPEVEVRVLGPIEIVGAARPFTRAWAVELIVYLVMHRSGATSEQWATALWPDRVMAAASLHSTASAARRSLGVSVSGDDHLPRGHGRLQLGPSVGSDWTRFAELSERPDPESWRLALELIRGRPFEGLRAPDWVLLEGIAASVEAVVVDLARRYAEHCLSAGDPDGAEWSARQGLRVSAYDERLYRILLRAADAVGNPAGVESVMAELVRLVAEDIEPYDAVHPETLELYRSLSRRSTSTVNR
jgi:DNA-binding SARP family transcriptional activator